MHYAYRALAGHLRMLAGKALHARSAHIARVEEDSQIRVVINAALHHGDLGDVTFGPAPSSTMATCN
jgi:hypothetical protein